MLNLPISQINPYCKLLSKKLNRLNLKTIKDLLYYYPVKYEDLSNIKKIKELRIAELATIKVKLISIKNYKSSNKGKKITEAIFKDETGQIKAIWFNQWFLEKNLLLNTKYYLIVKLNSYKKEVISPEYEKVSLNPIHTARIIPIYSLTYGLSQKQIRTVIKQVLNYVNKITEYLPQNIKEKNNLINLQNAITNIHFPASNTEKAKALKRLAFDELFFMNLKNLWLKKDLQKKKAYKIKFNKKQIVDFVNSLPFKLTNSQRKAAWEVLQDMSNNYPMNRLLNGDVGSGKTLVATIAIYNTALLGAQSSLLAPTEILAHQHYNTFYNLLNKYQIDLALLTKSSCLFNNKKINKKELIDKIKNGKINIIIGTHAIIQEYIEFKNLALSVIDEQHRFGVEQRAKLSSINNNYYPHLLSMTATPIPRTLSLTMYGDLNISILNEMPQGRKIIKTYLVNSRKRQNSYNFIKKEIKDGRQAFVICPLIDKSDKLGVKSVTQEYKKLNEEIFPDIKIGILHGKLKSQEKEKIMQDFKQNKINMLISTSVIEVGIDIPNATIMIIEGAERFGLAQLHQFRGRIGRGKYQSYCLLFPTENNTQRLKAMENITDGFLLAELDLKLRGPGKLYGKEQSGKINFKLADINNTFLIKETRDAVNNLLEKDPELKENQILYKYLTNELKNIHLE